MSKPFIKYPGGKRQLLSTLEQYFPQQIENYYELFVGGGSTFYNFGNRYKNIYLSDLNQELIITYLTVKNYPEELIFWLNSLKNTEEDYYNIRAKDYLLQFNFLDCNIPKELMIQIAARMIYLNKCGFNGLYRVSQKGIFNSPWGKNPSANYCDEKTIRDCSDFLNKYNIKFNYSSFDKIEIIQNENSFLYLDPPYYPIKKTSFVEYTKKRFDEQDQINLAKLVTQLANNGVSSVSSNSGCDFIKELYSEHKIFDVQATRMINSDGWNRGSITEFIILAGPMFEDI